MMNYALKICLRLSKNAILKRKIILIIIDKATGKK